VRPGTDKLGPVAKRHDLSGTWPSLYRLWGRDPDSNDIHWVCDGLGTDGHQRWEAGLIFYIDALLLVVCAIMLLALIRLLSPTCGLFASSVVGQIF